MMKRTKNALKKSDSIDDLVAAYDASARDAAWKLRQVTFDHSRESIAVLEEILEEIAAEARRPSLKRRIGLGRGEEEMEQWANLWGIYLGETLRMLLGGIWITGHEEAPNLLAVEFPDGTVTFPTARVFRRLEQGAEQSVVEYVDLVVREVGE